MPKDFKAFTITANGYLREIFTTTTICQAKNIRDIYKIPLKNLEVRAIWDTGAMMSSLSPGIVKKLKLKPTSKASVSAAGTSYTSNVYQIDILLPNDVTIINVKATEAPNLQDLEMLIGMDIIHLGDFSITNADKQSVVSFRIPPDERHIDYVKDANRIIEKRKRRHSIKKLRKH